jgi:hypothetical protein
MKLPDLFVEIETLEDDGYQPEDFVEPCAIRLSGDPITWPADVQHQLLLREMKWRQTAGRIEIKAVVNVFAEDTDQYWCCRRIWWRPYEEDSVSQPSGREASGSRPVDAATASARPIPVGT